MREVEVAQRTRSGAGGRGHQHVVGTFPGYSADRIVGLPVARILEWVTAEIGCFS